MKNQAFEALIGILNNLLAALLEYGYKLHDADFPEYYVSKVEYDRQDDKIKVYFKDE